MEGFEFLNNFKIDIEPSEVCFYFFNIKGYKT